MLTLKMLSSFDLFVQLLLFLYLHLILIKLLLLSLWLFLELLEIWFDFNIPKVNILYLLRVILQILNGYLLCRIRHLILLLLLQNMTTMLILLILPFSLFSRNSKCLSIIAV